ncbi:MAG: Npt1/Npt2 family nucleotide transporter [Myxococcota bacterium]|nr:Npt1/Npt2 family nucleotide transporter [Myxococcota bacterium]
MKVEHARVPLGQIIILGGLGFFVLASYAIARPAIDSLYIDAFTADQLPYAWLGVGVTATVVVLGYGKITAQRELTSVLRGVLYATAVTLLILMLWFRSGSKIAIYCLYVWKDVYIVVLIEMFWSISNGLFKLKEAKWLYGFFCVIGSLGGMTANLAIGPIAKTIGTANAPWLVLPIFIVCAALAFKMPSVHRPAQSDGHQADFWVGLRVIRKSDYLGFLVLVIALTQIAITLIDFEFNRVVESHYPDKDERTAVIGHVYAAIDIASLVLQLAAGLIISALGVGRTLLGIPIVLGALLGAFLVVPSAAIMSLTKICSKALDYSIFRASKELLYLPLNPAEKTQGKAVVDMLTYRLAKAGASVAILGISAAYASGLGTTIAAFVLVLAWLAVTVRLLPRYRARQADVDVSA